MKMRSVPWHEMSQEKPGPYDFPVICWYRYGDGRAGTVVCREPQDVEDSDLPWRSWASLKAVPNRQTAG